VLISFPTGFTLRILLCVSRMSSLLSLVFLCPFVSASRFHSRIEVMG